MQALFKVCFAPGSDDFLAWEGHEFSYDNISRSVLSKALQGFSSFLNDGKCRLNTVFPTCKEILCKRGPRNIVKNCSFGMNRYVQSLDHSIDLLNVQSISKLVFQGPAPIYTNMNPSKQIYFIK